MRGVPRRARRREGEAAARRKPNSSRSGSPRASMALRGPPSYCCSAAAGGAQRDCAAGGHAPKSRPRRRRRQLGALITRDRESGLHALERRTDAGNEHRRTPRGTPQDAPHHTRPKKASVTLQYRPGSPVDKLPQTCTLLVRNMFGMPARAQARYARLRPSVATLLLVRISLMHRGRAPLAYHEKWTARRSATLR